MRWVESGELREGIRGNSKVSDFGTRYKFGTLKKNKTYMIGGLGDCDTFWDKLKMGCF